MIPSIVQEKAVDTTTLNVVTTVTRDMIKFIGDPITVAAAKAKAGALNAATMPEMLLIQILWVWGEGKGGQKQFKSLDLEN